MTCPTVLEFAHLFAPTIRASLKQLTDTGFAYHTSSSAHYEAPDEIKLSFRELPTVPSMPSVPMAKEEQKLMRDWRGSYDKPVRQLTVRNQSTKDNLGTLPLYAYTAPDPAAKHVDFSVIVQDTATNGDRQNSQVRQGEVDPGATSDQVLFKENEVLILKPDHVRGLSPASSSFFVGTVIDVVTVDNSHEHTQWFFNVTLFTASTDNCLNFVEHGVVNGHRDAIVCPVAISDFQRGEDFIKLSEDFYEILLMKLNDVDDFTPEGEADFGSEDESDAAIAFAASRPTQTSSGRTVNRPVRFQGQDKQL